jgi:PAS domain S-box-containing protein
MFAALFETWSYPIIFKRLNGKITAWYPATERLYQYTAAEAIGRHIEIIIPPDRRDEHGFLVDKAVKNESIDDFETVRLSRNGRRIDVPLSLCPVKSRSGEIVGMAETARDITAHKFAEEKFRLAVESCPSDMVMADGAGAIVMVNSEIELLFGCRRDELIGRQFDILLPESLRAEHVRHRDGFARNPEARRRGADRDLFGRRKDGTEFPVEVGLNPIQTREGPLVFGVVVDITARKQAEEMSRLAVEVYPNGTVTADSSGMIVMVNAETEQLFGHCREELVGWPVDISLPTRLRSQHTAHRGKFAHRPEARRMGANRDLFAVQKDGTEFPAEVGLNPIQTRDGLLVLSVIVDISERKRIDRLKEEFISTVSHELRTPLTSISALLRLLSGAFDARLPEATKRLIAIAHSNSQRLVRLINDILDMEKIESGEVIFTLKRVDVRSLVAQAIETNRALADGDGVKLSLDGSLPHEVNADSDRLMQVITDLLSNAIKFSPPNAVVVAAVGSTGERVHITVRDHCPEIPEEFRSRIFQKFAQADASNARQSGRHRPRSKHRQADCSATRGEVGFCGAPGGGTIFYVEFPGLASVGHSDGGKERLGDRRMTLPEHDAGAEAPIHDRLGSARRGRDIADQDRGWKAI